MMQRRSALENPIGIETHHDSYIRKGMAGSQRIRKPNRDWNPSVTKVYIPDVTCRSALENPIGIETVTPVNAIVYEGLVAAH